jgi:hypothetical protein
VVPPNMPVRYVLVTPSRRNIYAAPSADSESAEADPESRQSLKRPLARPASA